MGSIGAVQWIFIFIFGKTFRAVAPSRDSDAVFSVQCGVQCGVEDIGP